MLSLNSLSFAQSYEITKVIEIKLDEGMPVSGTLRWSPDGTKVGFVSAPYLMYSDTLGNVTKVKELTERPRRFDWIDDNRIAIVHSTRRGRDSAEHRLSLYNIEDGSEVVVDRCGFSTETRR